MQRYGDYVLLKVYFEDTSKVFIKLYGICGKKLVGDSREVSVSINFVICTQNIASHLDIQVFLTNK